MLGIIESWLFDQIGLNCKLDNLNENNIFQDGYLFARILKQYGLIDGNITLYMGEKSEGNNSLKNLKMLKPVFEMLYILFDDTIMNEIVQNKISTTIKVLYELYLCLENKQTLYYLTKHYDVNFQESQCLDDDTPLMVEDSHGHTTRDSFNLEKPLLKNLDVVEWYRRKYQIIKNSLNAKENRIRNNTKCETKNNIMPQTRLTCCSVESTNNIESLPELDSFPKYNEDNLVDYKQYVQRFKSKQQKYLVKKNVEKTIQYDLLECTWDKITERQKEIYNSVFSEIMLKQSQYEKQILTKLIQTENQINAQNENQTEVMRKVQIEEEQNISRDEELREEFEALQIKYDNERRKVIELHRKLYKEKQELLRAAHYALCTEVVDSLVDVAVNASRYQQKYGENVPKTLWDSWKVLFCKSQPAHIPFEALDNDTTQQEGVNYDEFIQFERELDFVVCENDVSEYLHTCGRWFYRDVCLELGNINEKLLAYIIYRTLSVKYPPPQPPLPADIPPFQISGVLVNMHGKEWVDKLKILLEKRKIHIFDPDMVLKKSVYLFENETNSVPPSKSKTGKKTVKPATTKKSPNNTKSNAKKQVLSKGKGKKGNLDKVLVQDVTEPVNHLTDKETQTSIPEDDTENITITRTPLGILGEKVFNVLKEGRIVEDDLLIEVIVEYLKTLGEYSGWLILNYPENLHQVSKFELSLTGKNLPMHYRIENEVETVEDQGIDENSAYRTSKLLSLPTDQILSPPFRTYFTVFGNILQNQTVRVSVHNLEEDSQQSTPDNIKDLRNIYQDQSIYQEFSFDSWDIPALKALARAILGVSDKEETNSVELFGEEALAKLTKGKGKSKIAKSSSKKGKENVKKSKKQSKSHTEENIENDTQRIDGPETNLDILDTTDQTDEIVRNLSLTPNDDGWKFVSLPLSEELSIMIASVWESIEACYLETLKDILFEIRVVNLRLIPYVTYIKEIMQNVVKQPDVRQDLVKMFIDHYNEMEDRLRVIPDVKSYLHCKVLDLQQRLWEIMDEKRLYVESNRQRLIRENWLMAEITLLVNNFLGLVQNEYDRSLKTFYLINDYYFGLLDKVPTVKTNVFNRLISKVSQERLLKIDNLSNQNSKIEENFEGVSTKNSDDNFIVRRLVDCNGGEEHNLGLITKFIHLETEATLQQMLTVFQSFSSQHKKEEDLFKANVRKLIKEKFDDKKTNKSVKVPEKKSKNKSKETKAVTKTIEKEAGTKCVTTAIVNNENNNDEKELLFKEWQCALDSEIRRFECRMNLIDKRAQEDILEFYFYLETVFCDIYSKNLKKYDVDISNTHNLCSFFHTAIEEEVDHLRPITFNENEFFIELGEEVHKAGSITELIECPVDGCHFTVRQLKRLRNIFAIAGPYGVIRKQPLCYILQDLMLFNADDNQPHLPRKWNLLNESQLKSVIDTLFGPEYAIDWRDFLIYNLEIPFPNIDEILSLRQHFISFDTEHSEVVSFHVYKDTTLWFEQELPRDPQEGLRIAMVKSLLFDMFKINDEQINYTALLLYFCKDAEPSLGFQKALCLSVGKHVIISEDELNELIQKELEVRKSIMNLLQNIVESIVLNREGVLIYEIGDSSFEDLPKGDDEAEITSVKSEYESIISEDIDLLSKYSEFSANQIDEEILFDQISTGDVDPGNRSWVSRIPLVAVSSVLNASFIHQDKTFTLRKQYLNCLEEEADAEGMMEAHELVSLDCIKNLFIMTYKFKLTSPCEILERCLDVY